MGLFCGEKGPSIHIHSLGLPCGVILLGMLGYAISALLLAVVSCAPSGGAGGSPRVKCIQSEVANCLARPEPPFWPEDAPRVECRFMQCFIACNTSAEPSEILSLSDTIQEQYSQLVTWHHDGTCVHPPPCANWFIEVCKMYISNEHFNPNCKQLYCYEPCIVSRGDANALGAAASSTYKVESLDIEHQMVLTSLVEAGCERWKPSHINMGTRTRRRK